MVLPKENHMLLTEAATLDRKSGEGEGPAVSPQDATKASGLPIYAPVVVAEEAAGVALRPALYR